MLFVAVAAFLYFASMMTADGSTISLPNFVTDDYG